MKCPYQDIGCWYIDDVSHDCEARSKSDCQYETRHEQQDSRKKPAIEEENKEISVMNKNRLVCCDGKLTKIGKTIADINIRMSERKREADKNAAK
jgi:hypothetical protein